MDESRAQTERGSVRRAAEQLGHLAAQRGGVRPSGDDAASDDREDLSTVWAVLTASEVAAAFTSAATLLGVAQLGFPGQLVEVDVTAVLPA